MRYYSGLMIMIILVSFSCQNKSMEVSDEKKIREIALKISLGFDLIRVNKGGLNAVMSVVYIPPGLDIEESRLMVDSLIRLITDYPAKYPEKFANASTPDDIINNYKNGVFSLTMCLENGAPIGDDLSYIKQL